MKKYKLITILILAGSLSISVSAGTIVSGGTATAPTGFGGWNLGNVDVVLDNGAFYPLSGAYSFDPNYSDHTYQANVFDDAGTQMGIVLAKDWPVGEPPGIKVINGDGGVKFPKPQNCIMATSYLADHYLDSEEPQQAICSSGFQTHKRYKLAMLPSTVVGGNSDSVDLVFNVVAGATSDYQVFQKINNWTNGRLEGFTIQVGFGIGSQFTAAGPNNPDLYLTVPSEIWAANQLANFSEGLFGPFDDNTGTLGFFDPKQRAGFFIDEYVAAPGTSVPTDTLHSAGTLGSDYAQVPPGTGPTSQFGPWLPNNMLPQGIFFDDDGNPETDALLVAWYGYNPETRSLGWMSGSQGADGKTPANAFEAISDTAIVEMGKNLSYTMDVIDDLVNVGLNYIVTVGDVSAFPEFSGATFTIRITPTKDTSVLPAPEFVGKIPDPLLIFESSDAVVLLEPKDTFTIGSLLTARVGDSDLNDSETAADTVDVKIAANNGDGGVVISSQTLRLTELGENRGVFAATLPDEFSNVAVGTVVTMTYLDENTTGDAIKESSTRAVLEVEPILSDVSITDFTVPVTIADGLSRTLKVSILNSKDAEGSASGNVTVIGSVGGVERYFFAPAEFVDLKVNGKLKFSFRWNAALEDPEIAEQVSWSAIITINAQEIDTASGSTSVEVKKGKNSKE